MAASWVQWSKTDTRGIREFWYNPCKPIFYRIFGREIDEMGESKITAICDQLSHILSVMVQSKIVSYKDLGIEDFRTQRARTGFAFQNGDGVNRRFCTGTMLERDGRFRPSPNRRVKKVSDLPEKGFQTDGNQRDPPPYSVVKKESSG